MLIKEVSGEYRGYSWCIVRRNTKKRLIPENHTLRLRFLAEEAIDVRACDRESFTEYFSLDMMYGNVGRYLGEFKKQPGMKLTI